MPRSPEEGSGEPNIWQQYPALIQRFYEEHPKYTQLCEEVTFTLEQKLNDAGIVFASISWRVKKLESFIGKIERKGYEDPFVQTTDFAGTRLVHLYTDDAEQIEQIIRDSFDVIDKVNKLEQQGADKFGYLAVHFLVRLSGAAAGPRYDMLKDYVAEIQTRTVLQDAWAIIDHHLAYKKETELDPHLRRKLNSLAGALETADDQFANIRRERDQIRTAEQAEEIQGNPHGGEPPQKELE